MLLLILGISFLSPLQASEKVAYWNILISEYRTQKDTSRLTHTFDSLIRKADRKGKKSLTILYKTLLAELHFNQKDRKNEQSERLFAEAYSLAQESRHIGLQIWTSTQYGYYYYSTSDYLTAFPYFLETSRALESYPVNQIPEVYSVLTKNAYYFGTADDDDLSLKLLEKALPLVSKNSQEYASLLFGLGRVYIKTNDSKTAEQYFLRSLDAAQNGSDKIRYAKGLGELASIYYQQGKSEQAIEYLLEDIKLSEQLDDQRNAMYAQLQLGRIYYELGDLYKSEDFLNRAVEHAETKTYLKGYEKEIIEIQLKIAIFRHDETRELALRRKLDDINLYISNTDGQEIINKINWQSQRERIQWQLDAKKAKLQRSSLVKWIWAITSLLLSFIVFLSIKVNKKRLKLQQLMSERKIFSFELEKIKSEKILKDTNRSLASFQVYLKEKEQQINKLEQEIHKIKNNSDNRAKEEQVSLESLLDSHLMTDENWTYFKEAFIADKKDFYNKVITTYPGLSESNLRIILLQNLGLNNKEVSHLLGITVDAVKKSKQRMRKKYRVETNALLLIH